MGTLLTSVVKKILLWNAGHFFKLAIFFTKKHLFISLLPNCKIKIAYVWTEPKRNQLIPINRTNENVLFQY